jgi:ectoine hydroxylase-related dioxygenase (phytanoyl-CoA dioxygenase family)
MLTEDQIDFYRENGYVLARGLFSEEEAASYRLESHELIARLTDQQGADSTWGSARDLAMGPTTIQGQHDVQFLSAEFTKLIVDERLTGAAARLMGGQNVQLHHTKIFVKPPEQGSPFPMHQDHPFFPHHKHSVLAAIVHFDDAPEEKGCVRVMPGSHRLGPLVHDMTGSPHLPVDEYPLEAAVACPATAGDVLFFSYLTVHGSGVNTSAEARTTLLVQMRDPEDPPANDAHRSPGQGMMLRGIDPTRTGEST